MERKKTKWAEEEEKLAIGQAGFRPKHSTVDHCPTFRHMIEKIWDAKEELWCYFVDFSKREVMGMAHSVEAQGVGRWRVAINRLYKQVFSQDEKLDKII
jgi:hypothetical protein